MVTELTIERLFEDLPWARIPAQYRQICVVPDAKVAGHVEVEREIGIEATWEVHKYYRSTRYSAQPLETFKFKGVTYLVVTIEVALGALVWRDPVNPVNAIAPGQESVMTEYDIANEAHQREIQTLWFGIISGAKNPPRDEDDLAEYLEGIRQGSRVWNRVKENISRALRISSTSSSEDSRLADAWVAAGKQMFWKPETTHAALSDNSNEGGNYSATIATLLDKYFSLSEIEGLCFDMGIDHESLRGETKVQKIRAFVTLVNQTNRWSELMPTLKRQRRNVAWPTQ